MSARAWFVGFAATVTLAACETPPPGELVGRYEIKGRMRADSCGPGFGANRSVTFTAELRDDEGTGYWLFADLQPTPGTLDLDGDFSFAREGGWELVSAKPEIGYAGCRVAQLETIEGRVKRTDLDDDSDAGVAEDDGDDTSDEQSADLAAVNQIDIAPLSGDDCSPALATSGGPFLALPCRIVYDLTGTRTDD